MVSAELWPRLRRDGAAMLGLGTVAALTVFAVVGPLLLGDPEISDFGLERSAVGGPPPPTPAHPLGTDSLYRDLLARLAHGARLSLGIAAGATLLALFVGAAFGIAAGWLAGTRLRRLDDLLMRVVDVALAFPYLLLVTAIGAALERTDVVTVVLVLGLTSWTGVARLVRTKTMQIKSRDYVTAAVALGVRPASILGRHVVPGLTPSLLVLGSHALGQMILAEAVLGYLTVGVPPPQASWGRMLHEAEHFLGVQPLLVAAPGLCILVAVLGFTRLGDGLREAVEPGAAAIAPRGRFRWAADVVLVGAAVLLVATSSPDALPAPGAHGSARGTLRVATTAAVSLLDPALANDEATRAVNDLVLATLVTWDDSGKLVPELAAGMTVEDDGRRYRFVLRPGLTFHDGSPLAAADVKRSLERTLHRDSPCPFASRYGGITGFAAFRAGKAGELAGVVVEDATTLTIQLAEPDAAFPALLALGFAAPVCPSMGAFADRKAALPPCAAGPFQVVEMVRGEHLVLRRFPGYAQADRVSLDGVEWLFDVPARAQRYRFEAGELDVVTDLTGIDAVRFAADPRWEPHRYWAERPVMQGIFLNTERAPFDDVHVRRAVALAVDGSVLAKVRPDIEDLGRIVPPAVPGAGSEPLRRHDLAAALAEMELAGLAYDPSSGRGGWREPIDYLTVPDTFEQTAAEVFRQQLGRIGLRVRLRMVSWAGLLALAGKRGEAQMGWRGWGADYPDPATFFEPLLMSASIQPEGSQNTSFFADDELDRVVAAARHEADAAARAALYERAETIVRDEAPLVPVYTTRALHLVQPWVRGYAPHPLTLRLRWIGVDGGDR
jgi:ABC-type dipeptide/oligopeptide/nickel transport system permease subunit/ABC-type transport system substrate-binding protein